MPDPSSFLAFVRHPIIEVVPVQFDNNFGSEALGQTKHIVLPLVKLASPRLIIFASNYCLTSRASTDRVEDNSKGG